MKINYRHYILILFALVTLALSIITYIFLYNKSLEQVKSYASSTREMNLEDERKKHEQEMIKIFESTKDDRGKIILFTVKKDKAVDFIEVVEKIGDSASIDFELSSLTGDKGNIKARINAKGSWANIMKALSLIENLPFSIKISNVTLNTSSGLDRNMGDSIGLKSGASASLANLSFWFLALDIETLTTK